MPNQTIVPGKDFCHFNQIIEAMNTLNEAALFPTTHWSVVQAARGANADASKQAIDTLFATYWKPVYGYIRHLGRTEQDAEDLTQEFFKQMMVRRNLFLEVRQEKGKLRTYVCFAVKRMVSTAARDEGRLKRGGDLKFVSLDSERDAFEAADEGTPDRFFDRQWAAALIDRTLTELEAEYIASGKEELFQELRPFLGLDETHEPQGEVAKRLGMNTGALRMSLLRMRERFGGMFRDRVKATVL
jgi:RNA polymerase sigma factor (sigma-70 family)